MKKKSLLVTILLLIAIFALSLTACDIKPNTLETLKNDYGIVIQV
jgi:predicted small secreted protein